MHLQHTYRRLADTQMPARHEHLESFGLLADHTLGHCGRPWSSFCFVGASSSHAAVRSNSIASKRASSSAFLRLACSSDTVKKSVIFFRVDKLIVSLTISCISSACAAVLTRASSPVLPFPLKQPGRDRFRLQSSHDDVCFWSLDKSSDSLKICWITRGSVSPSIHPVFKANVRD